MKIVAVFLTRTTNWKVIHIPLVHSPCPLCNDSLLSIKVIVGHSQINQMTERERTKVSKFLSLVLRHRPESIGIVLDEQGWTDVERLLRQFENDGRTLTRGELEEVVRSNSKKRFALSEDGQRIRANQGHSIDVDLDLQSLLPPEYLYHGTVAKFIDSIKARGLTKQKRHHVHLSSEKDRAAKVGERRGAPVILTIRAKDMATSGYEFYRSQNGVWLTEAVPPNFIIFT